MGRTHQVEVRDDCLYLVSSRSLAAGSERRWRDQQTVVEDGAVALSNAERWDRLGRQGRGGVFNEMRADITRAVTIFFSGVGVIAVIATIVVLYFAGHLG